MGFAPAITRIAWMFAARYLRSECQADYLIWSRAARGMRGAPDWLAEVLSPSTASYDQKIKVPAYERSGVREVWVIHSIERTVAIYRLESGRYGPATVLELKGRVPLTAVPDVIIDWDLVIARML